MQAFKFEVSKLTFKENYKGLKIDWFQQDNNWEDYRTFLGVNLNTTYLEEDYAESDSAGTDDLNDM